VPAYGTTELHILRVLPKPGASDFLFYLTISDTFSGNWEKLKCRGLLGQQKRRFLQFFTKDLYIPLPPLGEQRGIADWLDTSHEKKIDTLLEERHSH